MELNDALKIIRNLAQGINPINSEKFPADSPYNHHTIIRALYTVLEKSPAQRKTPAEKQEENMTKGLPKNSGLSWSDDDRKEVVTHFRNGNSIDELAEKYERTKGAIVSELVRQQILTLEQARSLQGGYTYYREQRA